jgi:transcriptional regulator with XRE-family HTH domain
MSALLDDKIISANIRLIRKMQGLKAYEIAEKLGITESAYSRYERGEGALSISQLRRIADALNSDPIKLLSVNLQNYFSTENHLLNSNSDNNFQSITEEQNHKILTLIAKVSQICDATLNSLVKGEKIKERF